MSIKHTSTTVGTKSLEAIVAEFRADAESPPEPTPPDNTPGWVEAALLRTKLGHNKDQFKRFMQPRVVAGKYVKGYGTKVTKAGKLTGAAYYRIAPNVAQIAPLAPKPAKRGARHAHPAGRMRGRFGRAAGVAGGTGINLS